MDFYHLYSAQNLSFKGFYAKKVGQIGQQAVEHLLETRDYILVGRNVRIGNYGEIDLIMRSPAGKIIFIEVKSSFTNKPPMDDSAPITLLETNNAFAMLREPAFSAYERIPRKRRLKVYGSVERYCMKQGIDFDDNIEIYLAHIILFSKELSFKEFGIEDDVDQSTFLKNLYYKPQFFRL